MPRLSLNSTLVPLLLIAVYALSACASQAVHLPVVAKCPQFPTPPQTLMSPPQAKNALSELETLLQSLLGDASTTRPASPPSSNGSGNNKP